jgi:predicted Rossmann-fold nucleotide-binding protein
LLLGIHAKPIGLLNVDGFFDGLETFLDHIVAEAFVQQVHRGTLLSDPDPARLIDRLLAFKMPNVPKWIPLSQR